MKPLFGTHPLVPFNARDPGQSGEPAYPVFLLFPQTPGADIRPLGYARISSRGLKGPFRAIVYASCSVILSSPDPPFVVAHLGHSGHFFR